MVILLILALLLRLYGINWDQGFHLHPDERMLIMVTERIHFFDALHPHFFNYGTLPIYILKGITQFADTFLKTTLSNYDGMLTAGRLLSTFTDIGTIILVYLIGLELFKKKTIALYSSFVYAFAFFTIQNTHFFVVDVFMTFFLTASFYALLLYIKNPSAKYIALLALACAAALATKFTAILFLPIILIVIFLQIIGPVHVNWRRTVIHILLFAFLTLIFNFIFIPYAYLDSVSFINDVSQQTKMSRDPYIFPYTLQYVGTLPYLYYLKNIFLWGFGPIMSLVALFGLYEILKNIKIISSKKLPATVVKTISENMSILAALLFYVPYFIVIGMSAVKFMRYMLPIYPLLALIAGLGLYKMRTVYGKLVFIVAIFLSLTWTILFVNIYSHEHTRIAATKWINNNIPAGSTLATEHWDDLLPLRGSDQYQYVEMSLYELPDDEAKWFTLKMKLEEADYIILASNRLYIPLQKLHDCQKYRSCYPLTAEYYKKLFAGELGFVKVYESNVYPSVSLFGRTFSLNDQSADESFTVYDHPKVIIFKKQVP